MNELVRKAHLTNPLAGGDDEPVQIIGTQGDRVIGRIDLLADELTVEGQRQRLFVGSNLHVPEEHRHTLMGVMLIMKSQGLGVAVAALGPSQQAVEVYQKLKWTDLILKRHILLRRSRSVLEKYVKPQAAARAISPLADAALAVHRGAVGVYRRARTRGLTARAVEAFPEALDAQLNRRPEVVQFHRSAKLLNWRLANTFKSDPRNRQQLYLIERAGAAVGYFMVKVRFHETATHRQFRNLLLGSIQDWMIFQDHPASLRDVVLLATRELSRMDVDAVELNLPPDQSGGWLKRLGFVGVGNVHFMFKAPPGSRLVDPRFVASLDHWWCRPGEGDNFFI